MNLAQKFDRFQRQGLFRFLKFIKAQRDAGVEPDAAPAAEENAVRLMSIHQSKGQEFPVVAIADLAKTFNMQDLREDIILDEEYGLCPRVKPPDHGGRYPGLTHWLAQRRQRRELLGEELRLLYVAMTRARDTLILTGGIAETKWETLWKTPAAITPQKIAGARSFADWLGMWFGARSAECGVRSEMQGALPELHWRIADETERFEKFRTPNPELRSEFSRARRVEGGQAARDAVVGISAFRGDPAGGQVIRHSFAAARRGNGRRGGTGFQISGFSKTAREDIRPTGSKSALRTQLSALVGGGSRHGAPQISPVFFNSGRNGFAIARRRGPAAGAGKDVVGGGARGAGLGGAGGFLEF